MSDKKRPVEETVSTLELSSDEIMEKIHEITTKSGTVKEKQRYFRKMMPDFVERYPALFNMACEPGFNSSRLEYMLRMRDNVSRNKISQHTASVKVGENLYTEYVKPLVDKSDKK